MLLPEAAYYVNPRSRWVNRQDHGALTRVNIDRARRTGLPRCESPRLDCGHPHLRTTAFAGRHRLDAIRHGLRR